MKKRRIVLALIGVAVSASGSGIFKTAALGVDAFQSFLCGINQLAPVSFGTVYIVVNALLLFLMLLLFRHRIGLSTVLTMIFPGYIIQYTQTALQLMIPNPTLGVRIAYLFIGILMCCFGIALYQTAALGISPYDGVSDILAYKWKLADYKYCRIGTDVFCIIAGVLIFLLKKGSLSGIQDYVGAGTVLAALFMGPLIVFFNKKAALLLLNGKKSYKCFHSITE